MNEKDVMREIEELEKSLQDTIEQLRQNLSANIGALQILGELKKRLFGGGDIDGNE